MNPYREHKKLNLKIFIANNEKEKNKSLEILHQIYFKLIKIKDFNNKNYDDEIFKLIINSQEEILKFLINSELKINNCEVILLEIFDNIDKINQSIISIESNIEDINSNFYNIALDYLNSNFSLKNLNDSDKLYLLESIINEFDKYSDNENLRKFNNVDLSINSSLLSYKSSILNYNDNSKIKNKLSHFNLNKDLIFDKIGLKDSNIKIDSLLLEIANLHEIKCLEINKCLKIKESLSKFKMKEINFLSKFTPIKEERSNFFKNK